MTMVMTKMAKSAMKIMSCFDVKHGDVTKLWSRHDKHGKEPHRGGDDNGDDIGDDMRDDGDMFERRCSLLFFLKLAVNHPPMQLHQTMRPKNRKAQCFKQPN